MQPFGRDAPLYHSVLLDCNFSAIVTAFIANAVVNMPCSAVGADCQRGHSGLVVGAAFCRTCLGLTSFRMCHDSFLLYYSLLFSLCLSFGWRTISAHSPPSGCSPFKASQRGSVEA